MADPDTNDAGLSVTGLAEFEALSTVVKAIQQLSPEARVRVFSAAATFLGISLVTGVSNARVASPFGAATTSAAPFSEDRTPSPKEFMLDKRANTDVERVATLGYYLTHYRDTPYFKTLDISKLNTEAAQLKFSNAAYAVDNATKAGLIVPASKGAKQLSAIGELYVQALPDRNAARAVLSQARPKKKPKRGGKNSSPLADDGRDTEAQ